MKYFGLLIKGILIGFISIAVPGLSASTIAIILGVYYAMINSISSIFKDFKKSVVFLSILILGYGIGSLGGAFMVSTVYKVAPLPLIFCILGLIIGSLPKMFKDLMPYRKQLSNWIVMILVIVVLIVYSYIIIEGEQVTFDNMQIYDYVILAFVGFITSVTLVVPGVDFAVVLLACGYYYAIINAISDLMTFNNVLHNIIVLATYLISYGIGAFCCSKIINKLIVKYEVKMKFVNLGFVLASPAVVIRKCIIDNPNYAATYSSGKLALGIVLAALGFILMIVFYHFASPDNKDRAHQTRHMLRFYFMILSQPIKAVRFLTTMKRMLKKRDQIPFEERYKYCMSLIDVVNKGGRTRPIFVGLENIPEETTMFVSNHQGRYDGIGIYSSLKDRPTSFLALESTMHAPMYYEFFQLLEAIYIDSNNPRSQVYATNKMTDKLKEGRNFIVFVEGGYEDNRNNLQEFKTGALKSAYDANVSITPVVLYDSWKVYGISSLKIIEPEIHYLKSIPYEEYKDMTRRELADMIKERMQEKLNELNKIKGVEFSESKEVVEN